MDVDVDCHRVTSRDGTSIGYLRRGAGPGVVLVQGAMADVYAYRDLAQELSSWCTVVSAERRGRGLSPRPYSSDHSISRDVEDVGAVMAATGATGIFGLSSGAVVALEAARTLEGVERVAVYEPPFYAAGISHVGVARLNDEITRGQLGAALLDSVLTAGTAPAFLQKIPRPVARTLARAVLMVQGRGSAPGSRLRDLLPGVRYDFQDVSEVDGDLQMFSSITIPALLLSGTRSPAFLRDAVRALLDVLPDVRHVEFTGLGHDGPWNDGDPTRVARALGTFFTDSRSTV